MSELRKTPNSFCSRSCAVTYNNRNKTYGVRRSKLEKFVEEQISNQFPDLKFESNFRKAIPFELDFYFPDLLLAIEINGIFHHKPIFGDQFSRIQEIDNQKIKLCLEAGIDLVVFDYEQDITKTLQDVCWLMVSERIKNTLATRAGNDPATPTLTASCSTN